MRMRVVEADYLEPCGAGLTTSADVVVWIDQKSGRALREVRRTNRSDDHGRCADEDPAALARSRLASMSDDGVADGPREDHSVSTIIAMPMPPPMQSVATPYLSFLARSAYSRVVRMRAPVAPIG